MLSFTVPTKPQGKGRARMRKDGHVFTPLKTVRYENLVSHCAAVAMAGRPLMSGPLELLIIAYVGIPVSWPKKRRAAALCGLERPTAKPDWDNIGKTLDALNGVVWLDDAQVAEARVRKIFAETPRLEITVASVF